MQGGNGKHEIHVAVLEPLVVVPQCRPLSIWADRIACELHEAVGAAAGSCCCWQPIYLSIYPRAGAHGQSGAVRSPSRPSVRWEGRDMHLSEWKARLHDGTDRRAAAPGGKIEPGGERRERREPRFGGVGFGYSLVREGRVEEKVKRIQVKLALEFCDLDGWRRLCASFSSAYLSQVPGVHSSFPHAIEKQADKNRKFSTDSLPGRRKKRIPNNDIASEASNMAFNLPNLQHLTNPTTGIAEPLPSGRRVETNLNPQRRRSNPAAVQDGETEGKPRGRALPMNTTTRRINPAALGPAEGLRLSEGRRGHGDGGEAGYRAPSIRIRTSFLVDLYFNNRMTLHGLSIQSHLASQTGEMEMGSAEKTVRGRRGKMKGEEKGWGLFIAPGNMTPSARARCTPVSIVDDEMYAVEAWMFGGMNRTSVTVTRAVAHRSSPRRWGTSHRTAVARQRQRQKANANVKYTPSSSATSVACLLAPEPRPCFQLGVSSCHACMGAARDPSMAHYTGTRGPWAGVMSVHCTKRGEGMEWASSLTLVDGAIALIKSTFLSDALEGDSHA
ncbi:hypothetical protein G7046_g3808 [Stylonectria norvegica]|nr:hypothetical protein G7046_g3808 [Stylonectria norvegica]